MWAWTWKSALIQPVVSTAWRSVTAIFAGPAGEIETARLTAMSHSGPRLTKTSWVPVGTCA